jgi:hypothetical protein
MEVSGQLHTPAALPPGEEPLFPLDRRLGGPQSRSGHGGEENSQIYTKKYIHIYIYIWTKITINR